MRALRFAQALAAATIVLSAAVAAVAAVRPILVADEGLHFVAIFLVVVAFGFSVVGHPRVKANGARFHVSLLDIARSAPPWAWVLLGLGLALMIAAQARLGEATLTDPAWYPGACTAGRWGGKGFVLTKGALFDRPDRIQCLAAFYVLFSTISILVASSGIRAADR